MAKYFIDEGKTVTILEPNEELKNQTAAKVCSLDFGITVDTIDNFYERPTSDYIYILDEFDHMVLKSHHKVSNNKIEGLWAFAKKNVIAFTATSNSTIEKFSSTLIGPPTLLKFISSYELSNGISPV